MKVLKVIGAAAITAIAILGNLGSFAQWAGIEFTGVVGTVIDAAPAWLPAASLLFGIFLGCNARAFGAWLHSKIFATEADIDAMFPETEADDDHEKMQEDQREIRAFMGLDFQVKAFLCVLYDEGSLELEGLYSDVNPEALCRYVDKETTSMGVRYRLVSWAREFLGKHEELLRDARAWIEEIHGSKVDDGRRIVRE